MVIDSDRARLTRIFGDCSACTTADDFARQSIRKFVRSQDHLALASPKATGRTLTAWQAYQAFGLDKLEEALDHGSAILAFDALEPATTLRRSREARGLEPEDVATFIGATASDILNAENPKRVNSIQFLENLAAALGIDESALTSRKSTASDDRLAFRLRRMKNTNPAFTPRNVLAFNEAAWVIQKQEILTDWLGKKADLRKLGFETDSRYGDKNYPAWQYGYDLAATTRRNLGIELAAPIESLRDLVETKLEIPLVHLELSNQFAGATLAIGRTRGIAININGLNENDWVRRSTIAHELGHLLWDPDEKLESLRVDTFGELEDQPPQLKHDWVEARANAFAIEFLAPREPALDIYKASSNKEMALRNVMVHFGVSFTSAKFQIWNALERTVPLESFRVEDVEPTSEWKARESFTNDFFVQDTVPISRRGHFALRVVEAMKNGLLSQDSAASFLHMSETALATKAHAIEDLFRKERRST